MFSLFKSIVHGVVCWHGANQWHSKGGYWLEHTPQRAGHVRAPLNIEALYFKDLILSRNLNKIMLKEDYFLKKSSKTATRITKTITANVLFLLYSRLLCSFYHRHKIFSPPFPGLSEP